MRNAASDLKISPNTVGKVYKQLIEVGVLETRSNTGTFVPGAKAPEGSRREFNRLIELIVIEAAAIRVDVEEIMPAVRRLAELRQKNSSLMKKLSRRY